MDSLDDLSTQLACIELELEAAIDAARRRGVPWGVIADCCGSKIETVRRRYDLTKARVGLVGIGVDVQPAPTIDEVRKWPAVVSVRQSARALGIPLEEAGDMVKRGDYPAETMRVGRRVVVLTLSVVDVLERRAAEGK